MSLVKFWRDFPKKNWNYIVHCFIAWVGFLYNDPFLKIGVFDDFLQAGGPKASLKRHLFFSKSFPILPGTLFGKLPTRHQRLGKSFFWGEGNLSWQGSVLEMDFLFFWFPTKGGDVEAYIYIYIYILVYISYITYIHIYIYVYTVYIYTNLHTHTHTYIYIYVFTHRLNFWSYLSSPDFFSKCDCRPVLFNEMIQATHFCCYAIFGWLASEPGLCLRIRIYQVTAGRNPLKDASPQKFRHTVDGRNPAPPGMYI